MPSAVSLLSVMFHLKLNDSTLYVIELKMNSTTFDT